jgi:hypothetical protein
MAQIAGQESKAQETKGGERGTPGRLMRALRRIASPESELVARDLRQTCAVLRAVPISSVEAGTANRVAGTVRSLRLQPLAGTPSLEVELYDGSGVITLVFLGRRRIAGIETGRHMTASGRVTSGEGRLTMYNPRYELLPHDFAGHAK